jgi:hypothetical protein
MMYVLAIILLAVHGDELVPEMAIGKVPAVIMAMIWVSALFLLGLLLLHRFRLHQTKERANFDTTIHFTQDDGGLRFATSEIEHYLKWQGISQLLL